MGFRRAAASLLFTVVVLSAQSLIDQALQWLQQGRPQSAEPLLEQAVRQQPRDAGARYLLGVVHFQTGRLESAEKHLEEAARLGPQRGEAWRFLGMAHAARGDFRGAEEPFGKACELEPKESGSCYYQGRNYYALSRFEEALAAFDRAAKGQRNAWRVHQGAGLALEALGRDGEAERRLLEAVRQSKGERRAADDPRIDLGAFLFRHARSEEALGVLEEVAREHPNSARVRFELGSVLAGLGRNAEAAGHLRKAVELEPAHWPAHLLLSKVCFRLGLAEEGRRHGEIGRAGTMRQGYGSAKHFNE